MTQMIKKVIKYTLIIVSVILILIVGHLIYTYLYYFYIPKLRVNSIVKKFEKASRNGDKKELLRLYSKENTMYSILTDKQESANMVKVHIREFENLFDDFEIGETELYNYYNEKQEIISSGGIMKKKDGKRRSFAVTLIYEDNQWKILRFEFPHAYRNE